MMAIANSLAGSGISPPLAAKKLQISDDAVPNLRVQRPRSGAVLLPYASFAVMYTDLAFGRFYSHRIIAGRV